MPRRAPLTDHSIDWLGAGLLATSTGSLLGLVSGWSPVPLDLRVVGALAVSALLLAVFAVVERRAREPILPFEILRNPIVAGSVASPWRSSGYVHVRDDLVRCRCSCRA